ncbi:hypothetical protein GCM10009555_076460 [Acrocarpospora macrocephala]|uniref:Circularly permuted type 2 ATP-grasp protein n=1 Tax=Acrocarpospora macrocephala TaxID=150177 RepID=A0A5M3WTY4_9ACTN|nr:hypothetical protein [Acrocarpospora macrocephala]GES12815.1 hypothetical protein Amac_064120 [Acrocarpospora macrocephala]
MMNRVTKEFLEECVGADDRLRTVVNRVSLPDAYAKTYGKALLPRPVFVEDTEIRGFADDLTQLFDILASLPQRLFDGDLRRYAASLGIGEELATIMLRGATGHVPVHGRADAYHDGTAFKLLEFNIGSELGGMDAAAMNCAFLQVPAFHRFAERHGLTYVDTAERVARVLREAARPVTGDRTPVVALLEATGGLAEAEHLFPAIANSMNAHDIDMRLGEVHQVRTKEGKLTLNGTPIDLVLRFFSSDQILTGSGGVEVLDPILRAHADGKTVLFTTLEAAMSASKSALALLSDNRLHSFYSASELDVIDRVVPWTRLLVDGPLHKRIEGVHLLDYCCLNQEQLILKPGVGYGGVGALIGGEATSAEWRAALSAAVGRGYVVQQIVTAAPEPVCDPRTGRIEDWSANWGVFITDEGYAGSFVRALKAEDGAVISYSNKGTRGAPVFSYTEGRSTALPHERKS